MSEGQPAGPTVNYIYAYGQERTGHLRADTVKEIRAKLAPYRFGLAAREIVKELHIGRDQKVLEIGSGLGMLGEAIQKEAGSGVSYYGIDLAVNSAIAGKKKNIEAVQADATVLPFGDNQFDSLVTTDVLEHIPDASHAAQEIYRVLKPGGKAFVVIADPSEGRFHAVTDHIARTNRATDVHFWETLFKEKGFNFLERESKKYRSNDWRQMFNLPVLRKFKDKAGFACAFNPIDRPGTYILQKPAVPLEQK